MEGNHPILKEPINTLNISPELKKHCSNCGFQTLGDVIKNTIDELIDKYEFTMHGILEFADIIKEKGIRNMVQEWN